MPIHGYNDKDEYSISLGWRKGQSIRPQWLIAGNVGDSFLILVRIMSRDLRRYIRQTNSRLIFGFILIVFIIGDGLIYIFLGREASIMGLICLLAGMSPVILILGVLWIIDWIARKNNQD